MKNLLLLRDDKFSCLRSFNLRSASATADRSICLSLFQNRIHHDPTSSCFGRRISYNRSGSCTGFLEMNPSILVSLSATAKKDLRSFLYADNQIIFSVQLNSIRNSSRIDSGDIPENWGLSSDSGHISIQPAQILLSVPDTHNDHKFHDKNLFSDFFLRSVFLTFAFST